eukprot:1534705-Amphidinium_carterae.1
MKDVIFLRSRLRVETRGGAKTKNSPCSASFACHGFLPACVRSRASSSAGPAQMRKLLASPQE